jgi:predicted component of type VI protein secretion system
MAYIILTAGGEEIDRVELREALVIGRSPECDLPVRDVLMSRHHCRLEPHMGTWRVVDLNSKNGTRLGWDRVRNTRLREGDTLRLGRTYLTFRCGAFEPSVAPPRRSKLVRPADPFEALAGTVTAFVLDDEERGGHEIPQSPAHAVAGHLSPSPGDDEPTWAADLPEEGDLATMAARPRRSTSHWAPPSPQPRYELGRTPVQRMTDISLQVHPQTDFHLPPAPRIARMSERSLFLAILGTVCTLTGAALMGAMWWRGGW